MSFCRSLGLGGLDTLFLTLPLMLAAMNRERAAQFALLKRLRLDPSLKYKLEDPPQSLLHSSDLGKSEDEAVKIAIDSRPDIRAVDDLYKAALLDVKTVAAGWYPRVDFGLGVAGVGRTLETHTVNGTDTVPATQRSLGEQLGDQWVYTVGLTLSWNIFDRFLTQVAEQKTSLIAQKARLDTEDLRTAIVADVRQAYGDCQIALRQVDTSRKSLQASLKAFEMIRAQFELGSANFIDLVSAQAALFQSESTSIQAQLGLELQKRALQYLVGVNQP